MSVSLAMGGRIYSHMQTRMEISSEPKFPKSAADAVVRHSWRNHVSPTKERKEEKRQKVISNREPILETADALSLFQATAVGIKHPYIIRLPLRRMTICIYLCHPLQIGWFPLPLASSNRIESTRIVSRPIAPYRFRNSTRA